MPVLIGPLTSALELIQAKLKPLARVCGFEYTPLYRPVPAPLFVGTDEELILSRYPILESEIRLLHSARSLLHDHNVACACGVVSSISGGQTLTGTLTRHPPRHALKARANRLFCGLF
jgi:hypothetical protein